MNQQNVIQVFTAVSSYSSTSSIRAFKSQERNTFHLNISIFRNWLDRKATVSSAHAIIRLLFCIGVDVCLRSDGFYLAKPLQIRLVHLLKILHVSQKNINLDHLLQAGARWFKYCFQVFDALILNQIGLEEVPTEFTKFRLDNIPHDPGRFRRQYCQ